MLIKTVRTLRNHWKKTLFASGVLSYGFIYLKNYVEIQNLMGIYCERASQFGKEPLPPNIPARHVTVILNPNANTRKATNDFEKYCAPLLHLAGIFVEVIKTESEGHAKTLMETLGKTDAIVVGGGDGTVSEVVTGLLRKTHENINLLIPLGILPLGKNNLTAKYLFSNNTNIEKVRNLADATLAIIEQTVKVIDIMKVEILEDASKPIYAVNSLKWGAFRDANGKKETYWYLGPLKSYATYIFNGLKSNLSWKCTAILDYNLPCEGCSYCYKQSMVAQPTSWLHKLIRDDRQQSKFASIVNPDCSQTHEKKVTTIDLNIFTNLLKKNSTPISKLNVEIGPETIKYFDFVREGLKFEKEETRNIQEALEARVIILNPQGGDGSWFSIDNEEYEVKPIKITLLPKLLNVFCLNSNRS